MDFLLLATYAILFSSREKDDSQTGTLKMTFSLSDNNDYSQVGVSIYIMDNLDYSLYNLEPDNSGIIKKDLLHGSYRAIVFYNGNRANSTFQIINSETILHKVSFLSE